MQIAINLPNDFVSFQSAADIERDIRKKLHHAGLEGALEVIREGAGELME